MCTTEYVKYSQKVLNIIIPIFCGVIGWIANVIWEKSKYKREQKTYYWKEKINAGKKATEFYLEYINLLNLIRLQFKLYKDNVIEGENLLINIQQENVEFYSQKLKHFPHYEYHHINLFYELIEDNNFKIVNDNSEILQKINKINQSQIIKNNEISELFGKMEDNYEKLYNNVLLHLKKIQKDLENEVK
ncbi:hypothetical protein [Flavobacterium frigoris]|uniref:Uncharacterized protein n=1 Tax=Flavobacterium frigoris TaxID=229204 RepID=A0A1H9RN32_FLAFI|nr:hypothetical protein [Flavobacterium frigoris]SER73968.1 hypothetical protein SAMN05444355_12228 [Flavobacterium frigoris]